MTNEQIDQIISSCYCFDMSTLSQFVTDIRLKARILNNEYIKVLNIEERQELYNLVFKNIMQQIEEEGYEYFYSKLPSFGAVQLMRGASKDKLIDCIEDKNLKLAMDYKVMMVKATGDVNYMKNFLKLNETRINDRQKVELIKSTRDVEYIKQYIEKIEFSIDNTVELIKATSDIQYIKQCIEGIPLSGKVKLIKFIRDEKYIKECIKRFNFSSSDKIELIKATNDEEYIKEYIESDEFSTNEKIELIRYFEDTDICELINNNELKLDEKTRETVMLINWEPNFIIKNVIPKVSVNFKLPKEMTIGIEIESEGELSEYIRECFGFEDWIAKDDLTLEEGGVEIVSPILTPNDEEANQIYVVNEVLNRIGQEVSDRCGAHIHIGSDYLTCKQSYINLMEIWCNTEKILYAVSNEENTIPRSGIDEFSAPIASKIRNALEKGSINLADEVELDEFILELQSIQAQENLKDVMYDTGKFQATLNNARYSGINFININNGKNTIEFRIANGTLNSDLWMENINLFGGIVAVSEEISKIQKKGIETDEERRKIDLFEKLKDDIEESEKIEILLELVGLDDKNYIHRYNSNIELINNDEYMVGIFSDIKGDIKIEDIVGGVIEGSSAILEQEAEKKLIAEMEKRLKISKELGH